MSQSASNVCSAFLTRVKVVNPCLILGYNSLDKIAGIIFIAGQEIPRNIKPSCFLILGQHSRHPSCQKLCYASQVSPPITHNQGVHGLDIFIRGGIFGAARPSTILNALSPTLKLCCPFFALSYMKQTPSQGFP